MGSRAGAEHPEDERRMRLDQAFERGGVASCVRRMSLPSESIAVTT
jgi:hypothetical protein